MKSGVKDHQKTTAELKKLVDSGRAQAKLPTALDSDHQQMLDELKGKTGKDFDPTTRFRSKHTRTLSRYLKPMPERETPRT
jgi:predicted outer membrane protein